MIGEIFGRTFDFVFRIGIVVVGVLFAVGADRRERNIVAEVVGGEILSVIGHLIADAFAFVEVPAVTFGFPCSDKFVKVYFVRCIRNFGFFRLFGSLRARIVRVFVIAAGDKDGQRKKQRYPPQNFTIFVIFFMFA